MEERSGTSDAACAGDGNLSTDNVKRQSYGQHSSNMEIQLAPSETKPFTRSDICCAVFCVALTVGVLYFLH